MFTEGQLVLKAAEHVKRGMAGPSKFAPKWEGSFFIREVNTSEYYHLAKMDESDLMDPINGKLLKQYHAKIVLCNFPFFFYISSK